MIEQEYFNWLCKKVHGYPKNTDLLRWLHQTEFVPKLVMDENRCKDGVELRHLFSSLNQALLWGESRRVIHDLYCKPCSMLEMMVAVAISFEDIMADDEQCDRTHVWFWEMVHALGLSNLSPGNDSRKFFNEKMRIFMAREYEPDGHGGLFIVRNHGDIRQAEIWMQALWHMNDILNKGDHYE